MTHTGVCRWNTDCRFCWFVHCGCFAVAEDQLSITSGENGQCVVIVFFVVVVSAAFVMVHGPQSCAWFVRVLWVWLSFVVTMGVVGRVGLRSRFPLPIRDRKTS